MNIYDQAIRMAIKRLNPAGLLAWLFFHLLDPDLIFNRWLDTQNAPFPGEPDRRCDCVAEFISASATQAPWACLVEAQGQWQTNFLGRVWQYVFILHDELRHGPYDQDRYQMLAAIVDLCDRPLPEVVTWVPRNAPAGKGLTAGGWCRHVYTESAEATLNDIASGKTSMSVLVLVPLMDGGDREETARRWREVVDQEKYAQKRANYAGLATTLSEKRDRKSLWAKITEEMKMEDSPFLIELFQRSRYLGEVKRAAEEKGVHTSLLDTLEVRCNTSPPADIVSAVQANRDLDLLRQWQRFAAVCDSFDAFREKIGLAGEANPAP